jgi:hypothetical protein
VSRGICVISLWFFLMILRFMKGILVFLYWKTIILFEKVVGARYVHAPASRCHTDVLWLVFCRRSFLTFFSLSFISFPEKVHICSLFFRFVNFSLFIFLLFYCCPWSYYKSFSYFQFSPWIAMSHIIIFFQCSHYSFSF